MQRFDPPGEETTSWERRRLRVALAAVLIAIAVGITATVAGALAHNETRRIDGDFEYHLYGWPWDWKTDAPESLIQEKRQNSENYRYLDNGFAPWVFLFTVAMWSIIALMVEGIVAVIGWQTWRLVGRVLSPTNR